jgi:hypothetical protein
MFYTERIPYDGFKEHCVGTEFKFAVLPRKCHISGRVIWLRYAYKQTAMWTGPGDPVFEHRWYDKVEFVTARLKGNI